MKTQDAAALFGAREDADKPYLDPTLPVVVRVDGVGFSKYTKGLVAPADDQFIEAMDCAAHAMVRMIPQTAYAFVQSDEISILVLPSTTWELPYGGGQQKLVSIAASAASTAFNARRAYDGGDAMAVFDGRAFNVDWDHVGDYFLWRQKTGWANSVTMTARTVFSHKQLAGVGVNDARQRLAETGVDPDFTPDGFRYGRHLYYRMTAGVREFTNTRTGETGTAEFNRRKPFFEDTPATGLAEFVNDSIRGIREAAVN